MVLTSQVNYSHNTFLLNRYDSLTGVPVSQQNLLLEKASILFNIGALYTQIGTRCNRQTQAGLEGAMDAFQKAAGAPPSGCWVPQLKWVCGSFPGLTGLKGPGQFPALL